MSEKFEVIGGQVCRDGAKQVGFVDLRGQDGQEVRIDLGFGATVDNGVTYLDVSLSEAPTLSGVAQVGYGGKLWKIQARPHNGQLVPLEVIGEDRDRLTWWQNYLASELVKVTSALGALPS